MALGIISFGLIAIMGLIPKGLGIVKESADEAAALNILAAVSADLQCGGYAANQNPLVDPDRALAVGRQPAKGGGGQVAGARLRHLDF